MSQDDQIVHATAVSIKDKGVLITGASGFGKSDLALRLIDRGATLISDDMVCLERCDETLHLIAPKNADGKMEIRNLGILQFGHISDSPLVLKIRLSKSPERFPMDGQVETIMGITIPIIEINAHEASAAIKVELALKQLMQ